jgi:hypothetical protein
MAVGMVVVAGLAGSAVAQERVRLDAVNDAAVGSGPNILATFNEQAADSINADQVWTGGGLGLNLNGAGVTVGMWDGGSVRASHEDFRTIQSNAGSTRVTNYDPAAIDGHATHVAGTIGAHGYYIAGGVDTRGMANAVAIRSRDFNNDLNEMLADAQNVGLRLSNHSYGFVQGWDSTRDFGGSIGTQYIWYGNRTASGVEDASFGTYGAKSQGIDYILYENPRLLSVWAAGNDRNDEAPSGITSYVAYFPSAPSAGYLAQASGTLGGAGYYHVSTSQYAAPGRDGNGGTGYDSLSSGGQVAKNTLVVGSIIDYTIDPQDGTAVALNAFSSFGPTDDGRLAPHVVANGDGVISTSNESDVAYAISSGTSMAAPGVTGAAALLLQHQRNLRPAGALDPLSSTQKALLVHTATDVVGGGAQVGPDYASGYGLVNTARAASFLTEAMSKPELTRDDHLVESTLSQSEVFSITGLQLTGSEFRATLAWTDLEAQFTQSGLDDASRVLVNDLDLWVTDADGNTYYPWTLNGASPSAAAVQTGRNSLDNLEQVWFDASLLTGSIFSLHVGHTGNLFFAPGSGIFGTQDFSLLFSGVTAVPEPSSLVLVGLGVATLLRRRRQG